MYMNSLMKYYKNLSDWCVFGAAMAEINENGNALYDLNRNNLGYSDRGIVIVDYADIDKGHYPENIEDIGISLMSLLSWTKFELGSAFRFGYVQYANDVGKEVFKILENDYNFILPILADKYILNNRNTIEHIKEKHDSWKKLKKTIKYGNLVESLDINEINDWRNFRKSISITGKEMLLADEYVYKKYLVTSIKETSFSDFIGAILNLNGIYMKMNKMYSAIGYLALAKKVVNLIEEDTLCICENQTMNIVKYINSAYKNAKEKHYNYLQQIERYSSYNLFKLFWIWERMDENNV